MKSRIISSSRLSFPLAAALAALLAAPVASAAILYRDNTAGGAINDGAGAWLGAGLWNNAGTPSASWTSGDGAIFGNNGAGGAVGLASPTTAASLTFNRFTGTYTLGTAAQEITLNGGITKNAGAGIVTFSALSPIKLGAAQTFANNSATNLVIGALSLDGNALTFSGTGVTTFEGNAGNVMSGAGGIIKSGTGALILDAGAPNPAHTFTGGIVVNGGAVRFQTAANVSDRGNVTLNGGYLGGRFGSSPTFAGGLGTGTTAIQILGGVSGFSGEGSSGSAITIGTAGSTLKWGATGVNGATGFFNPTVLLLGGDQGMNSNGIGTLNNAIDLNGATRTFTSLHANWDSAFNTGFTVNGAITNSAGTAAGIIRTGVGNICLIAANTYDGATTINGGTLMFRTAGTANSSSALNLGGGTLRLVNTAQVERFANGAAVTVSAGGGITYENTVGANLNYTETLGSVALNGGLLNVNLATNQNNATNNSQILTFGGLSQTGSGSVAFCATTTGPQASGGDNMIVVTSAGTTTSGEIIGSWATVGTTAALQTDYAVYNTDSVVPANVAAGAQSAWSTDNTTGTGTLNNTSSALFSGVLSATRNINSLRSTNNAASAVASNANITVTGHALAAGDVVTFSATTMPTGLTAGTPYYVVSAVAGTSIQVSASSTLTPIITPTGASTAMFANSGIQVSSGNNLGTTGILNASATTLNIVQTAGAGVVTLPTTAAGYLNITTGSGGITINAPVTNNTGALTLVKNGSGGTLVLNGVNTFSGNIAINAGTMQIGTNANANGANLNSGNYAGNIFIGAGANLDFQTNSNQILSGVISGDGNLLKRYIGTLTLGDDNTYTGKTTIGAITNAGDPTLVVSSFNSVNGGTPLLANSSLGAPTTIANGTIDMGSNNSSPNPTLRYTGAAATGETTDRVINFIFNTAATRTLDASNPSGLLKFTSAFTSNGTTTGSLVLTGTGNAEIAQGLPFAFNNCTKSGGSTWTLGGPVGSSGTFNLSGATAGSRLNINHSQALGTGTFLINGGDQAIIGNTSGANITLTTNNAQTWNNNFAVVATNSLNMGTGNVTMGGTRQITVTGAGTFTVGGVISGAALGITKLGAGTMALSGANTYSGATTVSAGILQIDAAAALPSGSLISLPKTGTNTGTLRLNTSGTNVYNNTFANFSSSNGLANGGTPNIQNVQGNNTMSGNMTLNAGGGNGVNIQSDAGLLTISGNLTTTSLATGNRPFSFGGAGNGVFSGVMSQAGGADISAIVKSGAGTWSVTGTTSSFTGGVTVLDGMLNVASVADTGSNSSIGAGGAINLSGQGTSGTLQYNGSTAVTTNRALTVAATGGTFDASGTGSGTLKFTGTFTSSSPQGTNLTYTNGSNVVTNGASVTPGTVGGGVMSVTATDLAPGTTITSISGNTYTLSNPFTGTTGAVASTFGSDVARTLTLTGSNAGANEVSSNMGNSAGGGVLSISKTGAGSWTLSGTNTYTGATTVSAGMLALGANDVLPNASAVSIGAATLDAATFTDTVGTLDTTAAAVINLGTGGALAFADSSAVDWTGGTLNITGTLGATSIRFGTTSGGLTSGQLAVISVNGSGAGTYTLDADGYLVSGGLDTTPPTLTSITDNVSGGPVDIGATVTYTVTFNEDIDSASVTSADFNNNGTAGITVGAISETSAGVFTVAVTANSAGSLKLRIPTGAVIEDVALNDLVVPVEDDTTITVLTLFDTWANATYVPPLTMKLAGDDQDGDTFINLMEFAFGTQPTVSSSGSIVWVNGGAVTTPGQPVAINMANPGVDYRAVFGRRKDYAAAGLTYTVEFSAGLNVWVPSAVTPTVLTGAGGLNASEIEAVSVPYPLLIDVGGNNFKKPTFFRLTISN